MLSLLSSPITYFHKFSVEDIKFKEFDASDAVFL